MTKGKKSGIRDKQALPIYTPPNPVISTASAGGLTAHREVPTSNGSLNDDSRAKRPKRIPLHDQRRINPTYRPGYYRRIVKDVGNRINSYQDAGYSIVEDGTQVSGSRSCDPGKFTNASAVYIGRDERGNEMLGYLMEIPLQYYEEDNAVKQKRIDEREKSMKRKFVVEDDTIANEYGEVRTHVQEGFLVRRDS